MDADDCQRISNGGRRPAAGQFQVSEGSSITDAVPLAAPADRGPVRWGIVGQGRSGRHHLERLSLRDDSRCVALCDVDGTLAPLVERWQLPLHKSVDELLARDALDVVFIALPATDARHELVRKCLAARQRVVVPNPLAFDVRKADELLQTATQHAGSLQVLSPRRGDSDFRTAKSVAESGRLGAITSAEMLIRQFAPPPTPSEYEPPEVWQLLADRVDQLLEWMPGTTGRVLAREGQSRWSQQPDCCALQIEFDGGARGRIEIDLASLTPLTTDWMLQGTDGGYANGRFCRATEEEEFVSSPVEALPSDLDSAYEAAVHRVRTGIWTGISAADALRAATLLSAARDSIRRGDWARF